MDADPVAVRREAARARRQLSEPLILAVVLVAVAAGTALVVHPIAGAVVAVGALAYVVVMVAPPDPEPQTAGVAVTRDEQPELWAEVEAAAAAAGAPVPDVLVIADAVQARLVHRTSGRGRRVKERRLEVGLPGLSMFTREELRVVLLGVLSRDTDLCIPHGAVLMRAATASERVLGTPGGGLIHDLRLRHARAVFDACEPVRAGPILASDSRAAGLVGRTQLEGALRKAHVGGTALNRFLEEYVLPILSAGRRPVNLYDGLRSYGADLSRDSLFEELHIDATTTSARWNPGEPSLGLRVTRVSASAGGDTATDDRDASALISGRTALEVELSRQVADHLMPGTELSPVDWAGVVEATTRIQLARAGRLAAVARAFEPGAPRAGGLRHVLRLLCSGQRSGVATGLAPELISLPDDERDAASVELLAEDPDSSVVSALIALVACRWQMSWGGAPRLVGPDGAVVDLDEWVNGAVANEVPAAVFIEWLGQVGVPLDAAA